MTDKQQNPGQSSPVVSALRKQAEEQARTMEPISLSTQTPEEIQQVFFELRVRQIELEMQNEEMRTAQAEIEAERACYFDLYDEAPVGCCNLSEEGVILEANLTAANLLGVTRSAMVNQPISRFILNEDQDIYYLHRKLLLETGSLQKCDLRLVKPDGGYIWAHLKETFDLAYDVSPLGRVVLIDITDRKRAEEALRESEEHFRNTFEYSAIGMALVSPEGNWLKVNNRVADFVGYTADELMCKTFQDITHPEDLDTDFDFVRQILAGEIKTYQMEKRYFHKDGHIVWVLLAVSLVRDKHGTPRHFISQIQDITDRKHREQQLAAALSEKEMLLREVHHRVKNNLAAIISLMDMQRRNLEDPGSRIILTELSNRIRSMSLIHEKLYRADSLATIDFYDYIQDLTSHLRTTFCPPDIICQVEALGVTIPLDLALPCGLVVNELVTNALKYAFPEGKPRPGKNDCRVLVRLQRDQDTYTLTVADNGIGCPAGFDWTETRTLGLTLVRMLGQHQLGGHYVVDQENGTSFTLTFTDRKEEVPVHG